MNKEKELNDLLEAFSKTEESFKKLLLGTVPLIIMSSNNYEISIKRKHQKQRCPQCDKSFEYDQSELMCSDCREEYGHTFISEL